MPRTFTIILLVVLVVVLYSIFSYFTITRPQKARRNKHGEMIKSLRPGDQVVTVGGICGTIVDIDEEAFIIEVTEGVNLVIMKPAIGQKISSTDSEVDKWIEKDEDDTGVEELVVREEK